MRAFSGPLLHTALTLSPGLLMNQLVRYIKGANLIIAKSMIDSPNDSIRHCKWSINGPETVPLVVEEV